MKRIFPQLAKNLAVTDLSAFINDDSWVMEQKLDGHRLFIASPDVAGGAPVITNRNGQPYSKKIPKAIADFRFPPGQYILDGELIADVVDGHTVGGTFWLFDILVALNGEWSTEFSTEDRRVMLEAFINHCSTNHPFRIVPRARTRDEKIALSHRSLRDGYEGLVIKKLGKPYRSAGRTDEWLKLKFVATVDVVVTDVRADGKDSVGYAVYENGTLKPIGRASLIGKEKNGKINVGDVIEVRYLYCGSDGRLVQPTILGKRTDKAPHECTAEQLRYVNKDVLQSI